MTMLAVPLFLLLPQEPRPGQVGQPIEVFADPAPPTEDPTRRFAGQREQQGMLVLTASNGFFDRPVRAKGTAAIKDTQAQTYIAADFAHLEGWTSPDSTLRWHLWLEQAGSLCITGHFVVKADEAGATIAMTLAGQTQRLVTRAASDAEHPQDAITFPIERPGLHTLVLQAELLPGNATGQMHRLEVTGSAVTGARLLRARWRPAACHASFAASGVDDALAWVVSTRVASGNGQPSYSPVSTAFGYFGASFDGDGQCTGSLNFSMWSFRQGATRPQAEWSHLLALGSRDAEFGAFGHEGSGVKPRGPWAPLRGATEVTLALRAEDAPPWRRWYGYFLDPATRRFRFFAAGAQWLGSTATPTRLARPSAFVEQPGPPDRERSGDRLRDVERRGWVLDRARRWHALDTMRPGGRAAVAAKHWRATADGWFSMGMGGIALRAGDGAPVVLPGDPKTLPEWLPAALDDLWRLPARIGPRSVTRDDQVRAIVEFHLTDLQLTATESAQVTVFVGRADSLTFDRDLDYTGVATQAWPRRIGPVPARDGANRVVMDGLDASAPWHLRLLVETPHGRVWSFETDRL